MEQEAPAPTAFGKPLYFSCFSTVEVTLVQIRGAFKEMPTGDVVLIIDLVDAVRSPQQRNATLHARRKN